jgi:hypothetical protein
MEGKENWSPVPELAWYQDKLTDCPSVADNLNFNSIFFFSSLMTKFSKKLVSKCIYIQILKTTKTDLLGM